MKPLWLLPSALDITYQTSFRRENMCPYLINKETTTHIPKWLIHTLHSPYETLYPRVMIKNQSPYKHVFISLKWFGLEKNNTTCMMVPFSPHSHHHNITSPNDLQHQTKTQFTSHTPLLHTITNTINRQHGYVETHYSWWLHDGTRTSSCINLNSYVLSVAPKNHVTHLRSQTTHDHNLILIYHGFHWYSLNSMFPQTNTYTLYTHVHLHSRLSHLHQNPCVPLL